MSLTTALANDLAELKDHVEATLGDALVHAQIAYDELTVTVDRSKIIETLRFLRDDPLCRFIQLVDLAGVDYPGRAQRFDVVYHLLSLQDNARIRVKCAVGEEDTIPTATPVYPCADWYEREAFDLYGIVFEDHPDMRRLLTDYGFEGHPLRKDFPLTGFTEVRWDDEQSRVVYEPVQLTQEYRNFDYLSPWEGPLYVLPGDEKGTDDVAKPRK
ncbi:NADH-quinone oxidoreductase subunit C [Parvularcula dongshanensis]|uniref:NADH-quinone oxidoreductase subunit C n=1 Tax=Parvularcula dongshanensis TaxID=1173995 RepID=A0A840I3A5_9PROT|nr:NADH-quinone oxidoreductase subunit C [Parvularcula dongshanensis]MBB4659486.1 NADH-quinone oxidoreductase subunit C [Parvularcula dongshanensis]